MGNNPDDSQHGRLSIEIQNKSPVELMDLTKSLLALSDEYDRRTSRLGIQEEVRLYVKEIRSGSIIADLVAMAPCALPLIAHANEVVEFAKYLQSVVAYLAGEIHEKERPEIEKSDLENIIAIVEPVAKDNGSQINFTAKTVNMTVNFQVHSLKANAVQNAANRKLASMRQPVTGFKEKVLLYWYQARNDTKSRTGDKAIIESIHPGPVKTVFATESIKSRMLAVEGNPFSMAFVVDVAVETINQKPALYRIQAVHEIFERSDVDIATQ